MKTCKLHVNPFHATDLFQYPLKTSENLWFQGATKGTSGMIWVNQLFYQFSELFLLQMYPAISVNARSLVPFIY